MSKASVGLNTS